MHAPRISTALALTVTLVFALGFTTGCSAESADPAPDATAQADTGPAATKKSVAKLEGSIPELRYYTLDKSCPYCRDIVAVLEGSDPPKAGAAEPLRTTYADRVTIVVKPAFDAEYEPDPEIEAFGFGMSAHGAVGLLPSGEIAFTIPGHHFGRAQLVNAIEAMLKK